MIEVEEKHLKIMIIASDAFGIKILTSILESLGYPNVVSAESGAEALQLLGYVSCDVILSDLNMPDMDGIELMRHVTEIENTPSVILMSREDKKMQSATQLLAKARNLTMLGTLKKPVNPRALDDLLNSYKAPSEAVPRGDFKGLSVDEIRDGIKAGRVIVHIQPKVKARSKRVVGGEALARWQNEDGSILGPFSFIPVAEQNGLMGELTEAVIDATLEALVNWPPIANSLKLSINVSMDNLKDLSFADTLVKKAEEANIPPSRLILEVTETKIMEDTVGPLDILSRLKLRGVGLSIDDFGTGASGFENLQTLPFNELKIDRAFVDGAHADTDKRTILKSIFEVAKKLELQTVGEGVEVKEDWDLLTHMGCDVIQGYFMSKPMDPQAFILWLREHNNKYGLFFTGRHD